MRRRQHAGVGTRTSTLFAVAALLAGCGQAPPSANRTAAAEALPAAAAVGSATPPSEIVIADEPALQPEAVVPVAPAPPQQWPIASAGAGVDSAAVAPDGVQWGALVGANYGMAKGCGAPRELLDRYLERTGERGKKLATAGVSLDGYQAAFDTQAIRAEREARSTRTTLCPEILQQLRANVDASPWSKGIQGWE